MLATVVEVCGGITAHLTRKSSKTSCLQEKETLAAKTALRGWPNIAAHISHKCLLFSPRPRTSIGILWDLQVSAARGNRNICVLTSKVLKHANPCLLAFRIKLFPIGCRMGCIVPADWLIPFSATYASYLYELRKKVWWIALTNFLTNFVTFCSYELSYEKFGEYGPSTPWHKQTPRELSAPRHHAPHQFLSIPMTSVLRGTNTLRESSALPAMRGPVFRIFPL